MDEKSDEKLLLSEMPRFDSGAGLRRFQERIAQENVVPSGGWTDGLLARLALARGTWLRPASAAIGVVVVATALALTGVADTLFTVFEPKQLAPITVSTSDLRGIPDPSQYGTLTWIARPQWRSAAGAGDAATAAGFAALVPSSLPAGVPSTATFAVMGEAKATFQFDEAKARSAAAQVGATLPPMPATIASTTLTLSGGPAVMQQYGSAPSVPADTAAWGGNPQVLIVQARAPVVTSNGASVDELRDYALAQPGIPPSVAAQIRAIGDPVRTLMVPIGVDLDSAKVVTVRGTRGYLVGDSTGLGSGIAWLENGYVIGVLASLSENDLIALVNGLR